MRTKRKRCARCCRRRSVKRFPVLADGELFSYCLDCRREYGRDAYQKSKGTRLPKLKAYTRQYRERNRRYVLDYLRQHPCVDCGEGDPVVLQFDHVRGKKSFDVSQLVMARAAALETIQREIDKCEVRCANCHLRKTAKEEGWVRHLLAEASKET